MSKEAFERANQISRTLGTSEDFKHAEGSRGIRIQTESLVLGIAKLMVVYPEAERPLALMAALIKTVSDRGSYVVVAGSDPIFVEVRGFSDPTHENMSAEELTETWKRRSGVEIIINSEGRSGILAQSAEYSMRGVEKLINESLDELPEDQRTALVDDFLEVVAQEVAESGEFLDL